MKTLAKIIIALAIFVAGFYLGTQQALSPSNGYNEAVQSQTVNLMIDFGTDRIVTYAATEFAQGSVFDLLKQAAQANNFEIGYQDYGGDLGVFLESIDGVANDSRSGRYWQYWVNNVYAQVGLSNYQLKPGDVVTWKYLTNQFE
ncbi:MAG: DUF4430 domain-containing protein [Patescibacteria group bacterium]|jgi:hypothetical protein|nr:DUF4430 domain-containing protein [Patescibacteria group bacterium]